MPGTHVPLTRGSRREKPDAVPVGDVDPASRVEVTVTVAPERFAEESEAVTRILGEFGLSVAAVYPATGSLRVDGTAAQIEDAFRAGLRMYDHGPDGVLRGREGDVYVPAALEGIVTGVFGLDQRRVARRLTGAAAAESVAGSPGNPQTPEDLERRYSFPDAQGDGQTVAIAEFGGGYYPDDLGAFCQTHHRTVPQIEIVPVGASPLSPAQIAALPADQKGESHEVTMDVEIVAGLCPAAKIRMFFAPFDEKGWIDLLDAVVAEDPPPVSLCVSWGLAEDSTQWSRAAVDAINLRLGAASQRGITACAAAGDDGSGDQIPDGRAHVHFPASSPFVLAVGGTMDEGEGEVVWWNKPGDRSDPSEPRGGSTGGGVSVRFGRPAWQNVHVRSLNPGGFDGRVVPDVAALAGLPGYSIVFEGQTSMKGGTSAAAPLWAALIARIASATPSGPATPPAPAAFLTPLLYQNGGGGQPRGARGCTDITKGNNASPKPGVGYDAQTGFDAVSGWGVPNGRALLASL
jgi:kumamolisin